MNRTLPVVIIKLTMLIVLSLFAMTNVFAAQVVDARPDAIASETTKYQRAQIQGIEIAYREAGNSENPAIVLLHGFPTSSHMFRKLIPRLAKEYYVIAPDYPGYGSSDQPPADKFDYSFENFTAVVDELLQQIRVPNYVLYVMDYGAPVGFRLFAKHPERVRGFVIQNGNAYSEGLKEFWDPLKQYWKNPTAANGNKLRPFFELKATKWQWTHGIPEERQHLVSPDNWIHDQYLLDRPGNKNIQLRMFLDYRTNVDQYAHWQSLFRKHQPPALLVWGKNDVIFPEPGAHAFKKDLKDLEFHLLDTGHFALETHASFIAQRMLAFLDRTKE